ncbi:hypothetical protein AB4Z46_08620 [Variovorax sp. M-6]
MNTLPALSLAAVLAGCAATGDDYVKGVVPEVTNHPVLGTLNSKERALLGPDANENGVRDEIDRIVSTQHAGARAQALRFAMAFTEAMLSGAAAGTSRTAPAASELDAAASALDAVDGPQSSGTLAARIANSPERRAAASAADIKLAR